MEDRAEVLKPNVGPQSEETKRILGRLSFKGFDMAFLLVEGNEMFTLNEILGKLFSDTRRTTVVKRFLKMNAFRHWCSKEEVRALKVLKAIGPLAVNCTMFARKDVEKYYVLHGPNGELSVARTSTKTKKLCSTLVRNVSKESGVIKLNKVDTIANSSNGKDLPKGDTPQEDTESVATEHETSTAENENPQVQLSTDSVTCKPEPSAAIQNSPDEAGEAAKATTDIPIKQTYNNENNDQSGVRKRKRRTNLEILELHNGETSCGIIDKKRERKVCYRHEFQHWPISERKPRKQTTVQEGQNNEVVASKDKELNLKLEFDQNNNIEPRSPTFLLKRSVNNEWCIASSSVPTLDLDDEDQTLANLASACVANKQQTKGQPTGVKKKTKVVSKSTAAKSTCQGKNKTKGGQRKSKLKTNNLLHKQVPGNNKAEHDNNLKSSKIKKKRQPCKASKPAEAMKTEADIKVLSQEVSATDTKINDCQPDIPMHDEEYLYNLNGSVTTSPNGNKNEEIRMPIPRCRTEEQSTNGGEVIKLNKPVQAGSNEGANKPIKRRRRVQQNGFHLAETFPYASSLRVKDGDLYPAYTMIYSSANSDPGCCHALWRWRLGRPVAVIKQNPSPVSQPKSAEAEDMVSCDTVKEEFQYPPLPKDDEELVLDNSDTTTTSPDKVEVV